MNVANVLAILTMLIAVWVTHAYSVSGLQRKYRCAPLMQAKKFNDQLNSPPSSVHTHRQSNDLARTAASLTLVGIIAATVLLGSKAISAALSVAQIIAVVGGGKLLYDFATKESGGRKATEERRKDAAATDPDGQPQRGTEEAERTVRQLQAQLEELQQGLAADQAEAARLRGKLGKRKA